MRIVLESEEEILVKPTEESLAIEATSPELSYSAFHMLGSALGTCVLSVLSSWAEQAHIPADQLSVGVKWRFAEEPHRVDQFEVKLHWPGLPPERTATAQRVADLCGIHETLTHQPEIQVSLDQGGQTDQGAGAGAGAGGPGARGGPRSSGGPRAEGR